MRDFTPIQGFLSEGEGNKLYELGKDKNVLEIGSWKGRSTIAFAEGAKLVVSVDHFKGDEWTGAANTFPEFFENTSKYKNIISMRGKFEEVLPLLDLRMFDVVFYDGDHCIPPLRDFLGQIEDSINANESNIRTLILHDYEHVGQWIESTEFMDDFFNDRGWSFHVVERLAIVDLSQSFLS